MVQLSARPRVVLFLASLAVATCLLSGAHAQCSSSVVAWGQCGGYSNCPSGQGSDGLWQGYCCGAGFACTRQDQWFWSCRPGTEASPDYKLAYPGKQPAAAPPSYSYSPPPTTPVPVPPAVTPAKQQPAPKMNLTNWPMPPASPLYAAPKPTLAVVANIQVGNKGATIPQGFLGMSYEWGGVAHLASSRLYLDMMHQLQAYGTGPISLRIGGGSTDKLREVPPPATWQGLKRFRSKLGSSFIIGLPFEEGDKQLAKASMQMAESQLGGSIESFEIGNEPNFYTTKPGMTSNQYVGCCFIRDWQDMATHLSCPAGARSDDESCARDKFAGPVWGHVNMYPSTMNWFLSTTWRFVEMATLHWYKATSETYNTPETLLDESPIRAEMINLGQLVAVARNYGKPLRVAEMNSISNSGRANVSNVFASALWSLDACLEVAATGAVGVNFHQGSGQNMYTAVILPLGAPESTPLVRPAFYGFLALQMALGRGSRLLGKKVRGPDNVKVFPLEALATGQLRIVLINKNAKEGAAVQLNVGGGPNGGYGDALVTRLVSAAPMPLEGRGGISLGGMSYPFGSTTMSGQQTFEKVKAQKGSAGQTYRVYMPPGSAAIVGIPPANAAAQRRRTTPVRASPKAG